MSGNWIASYRLQLHAGFPLRRALEVLPYLAELGISHVYLSPCLQAVPGSQHGYDVADPTRISEDLGGESAWADFVDRARALGLRILLDIVPNHMSASQYNPWWDDVLAHGPYSKFAEYFDFRNRPHQPFRVHLCSLARPYGAALEAGELTIEAAAGAPRVRHYDNSWPLGPASWGRLLAAREDASAGAVACFSELERLLLVEAPSARERIEYARHASAAAEALADALRRGELQAAVDRAQNDKDLLDAVLQRQFYLLHGWKLAGELCNYRRFFDIGTLSGIRAELPSVFEATHARIEAMIARGEIHGLRVDHPDGLREPLEYFKRLRALLPQGRIYVEKILENDERLKEDWPIEGTVGYEFLAKVNRLWMDDQRIDVLTATYSDFTGHPVNFAALVREKKRAIVESTFSADHERLAEAALKIARGERQTRDLSPRQLREALARLIIALPIYRTYRTLNTLHDDDKRILAEAVQSARIGSPDIDSATFDFLATLLTKSRLNEAEADFVATWQQLTPAVMAKGVEDTTFYCFDRLVSCNEVGSQPSLVGISADKFHEFCHSLSDRWPNNLLATSTHDNKRSEDVRTRISILSEIPERWAEALHQWSKLNAAAWQNHVPDRHAEYLLYQTLIGAWPIDRERCWQYMLKACREAKINTSWHEPNNAYEESIRGFVDGIFQAPEFIASLERFVDPLILPGRINSLAQTLIKMVAPGVPDFYQGTELWDLSLVDPDNRRPVDFGLRAVLVSRARDLSAGDVLTQWDSGLPKLWMTLRLLATRGQRQEDFSDQSKYQPLVAQGTHLGRLLAFRRGENLIAVVPRFTLTLGGEWGDTRLPLPGGAWRNCFTDAVVQREVTPEALFNSFPVALLIRDAS
ncbi:MAG TPA: malto-oligosyltrehalose synthase [Steroidobacteraceae bacterium]|jgi:(1->4)-alpha-D-glucan 1-alpha-D-glucosylmutase|nr:malto-oligosyltrehalose synthase [Steroidobacteraceae bacterium]